MSQLRYDGNTFFDAAPALPYYPFQLPVGPESTDAGPEWLSQAQTAQARARDSSPAGHLDNITGPLLLIQGDADEEVPFQESLSLARYLRKKGGVSVETLFFPDECHGECAYEHQLAAGNATVAFLLRHLR